MKKKNKIIPFPQQKKSDDAAIKAMKSIENRFGVSFLEYMGITGDQDEVKKKIQLQLHKETLEMATRIAEEDGHKEST